VATRALTPHQKICINSKIPVIASGGVGKLEHLAQGLNAGASALLAASIFHFNEISINQAKEFLTKQKFPIRF
jgi:cyclase